MLTAAFHMLSNGTMYEDLTAAHFDKRDSTKLAKRLIRRLEDLGLKVTVAEAARDETAETESRQKTISRT